MAYGAHLKAYLRALQAQYNSAKTGGQHTAELSFRTPMDQFFRDLSCDLNPEEDIQVVLEPRNQGRVGRPDWRIHNDKTLGIYGYIEGKGLSEEPFDTKPYEDQIRKYLTLGHKLIISDGIDFVFCSDADQEPTVISLIDKSKMGRKDWSSVAVDPRFEVYMRNFFNNPSPQQCTEGKLVELVAVRTRILANEIMEYADIPLEEALNDNERQIIELLSGIKELVYNHNDPNLRTSSVFADFTAQVVMFSLLYAHRVLCSSSDAPIEKQNKIRKYITEDLTEGEALLPFRNLMLYIRDHADSGMFISQWVDECIKFLSFVRMTDEQLMNPDYHQLFELFLSKYDAQSRFDYGAFYTPKILADYVVRLTNYVTQKNFSGSSIYDKGNTIIDPCCGTGSFLEEVIAHDPGDGEYNLCGFEILPAPYMLANYRMAVVERQLGQRKHTTNILLANTLSDYLSGANPDVSTIEGYELKRASEMITMPLKLIIGNPPCSDTIRSNATDDFLLINKLMEDFRPPVASRRSRQNIQKQINNPFMQFIRWSCKKLLDSENHSVLSIVVPLSFLEAESYKYARKYLCEHFSDAWIVAIDADARTGIRSESLFRTLQGRAIIILTRKYGDNANISSYHFADYSDCNRTGKEVKLTDGIEGIINGFSDHEISKETFAFFPSKAFDEELYNEFWPVSGSDGQQAIFKQHCSGIKLAPTALFTHVKAAMLKRRSKDIAIGGQESGNPWFVNQDKPPKEEKIKAFQDALNECGGLSSIDQLLTENIHPYSFRPYLRSNVLLWTELLQKYARIGGGGTRLRPELIKAYSDENTVGFAMAHAPKDLNPTLSQFVSFCWYYPDNDMCTRGNSHIYMNQYPRSDSEGMENNINPELLESVSDLVQKNKRDTAKDLVFYTYAVLCSQVYLDEFEGALFTVNQSDKRARVPIVNEKVLFEDIADIGRKLALLERTDYVPDNLLGFDYESLMEKIPSGYKLVNSVHPFDEEKELLILTDGRTEIKVYCPVALQQLNISGYDVVKSVWLKFNSYNFTHCEFTKKDMRGLLDFLNTIEMHTRIVAEIDEKVRPILHKEKELMVP